MEIKPCPQCGNRDGGVMCLTRHGREVRKWFRKRWVYANQWACACGHAEPPHGDFLQDKVKWKSAEDLGA